MPTRFQNLKYQLTPRLLLESEMSRLHDLIQEAKRSNPALGNALAEEVAHLENQPTFGLVFERHAPEATELYKRPVARGDKVHILNARGDASKADQTLWRVLDILQDSTGATASLQETLPGDQEWNADTVGREPRTTTALIEDLVVVAEHTDTIYPGLTETGRVDNGPEDAPAHAVINGENLHALHALTYTHRHRIDCIYIDPPYNTGAKDWKYNNHYVEADDDYRHSKWLSFMEKRLRICKELLDPRDSVLIVTIDENELPRLLLLLENVFSEARISTVSVSINPKGVPENGFSRVDEAVIFVMVGSSTPSQISSTLSGSQGSKKFRWRGLARTGSNGIRAKSPGAYFPIFLNEDGSIHSSGEVPDPNDDGSSILPPPGTHAVWPTPRPDGTLGRWSVVKETFDTLHSIGAVRIGTQRDEFGNPALWYLTEPALRKIETGELVETGRDEQGAMVVEWASETSKTSAPTTLWSQSSHSASEHGTGQLNKLLPGRKFDYAKSLYAVEDSIRLFTLNKPDAVVLDFFAGSGTTAHAVMRLNKQDGGRRRSIMVTNNEVSADEQKELREKGLRPGDPEWEALGIADYVTKPRVTAAITGKTPAGDPIKGDYKFTDEFPMADGFEANARYFSLEYLNPTMVEYGYAFSRIAPMLWLRAGQVGEVITSIPERGWELTDHYAVIENCDDSGAFTAEVDARPEITHVYIITNSASVYQRVAKGLDDHIQAIQLYESYLTNFAINASRVLD